MVLGADARQDADLLRGPRVRHRHGQAVARVAARPFRVAVRVQVVWVGGDDVFDRGELGADFIYGLLMGEEEEKSVVSLVLSLSWRKLGG